MKALARLKDQARQLKQHTLMVYFAARDPRTPFLVRLLAILIAAYALSPIDLIPDFIPVIGYLDDLVLIPLGLALVVRLIPQEVVDAAKEKALHATTRPVSYTAAVFFVSVWLVIAAVLIRWLVNVVRT